MSRLDSRRGQVFKREEKSASAAWQVAFGAESCRVQLFRSLTADVCRVVAGPATMLAPSEVGGGGVASLSRPRRLAWKAELSLLSTRLEGIATCPADQLWRTHGPSVTRAARRYSQRCTREDGASSINYMYPRRWPGMTGAFSLAFLSTDTGVMLEATAEDWAK